MAKAVGETALADEAPAAFPLAHARHADPRRRVDRVAKLAEHPRRVVAHANVLSPERPVQEAFARQSEATSLRRVAKCSLGGRFVLPLCAANAPRVAHERLVVAAQWALVVQQPVSRNRCTERRRGCGAVVQPVSLLDKLHASEVRKHRRTAADGPLVVDTRLGVHTRRVDDIGL